MSDPAEKRAGQPGAMKDERSGRFAIDERLSPFLPPRGEDADLVSLDELGAVELDGEPAAERSPLPRGIVSGVFTAEGRTLAPPPVPATARPVSPVRELGSSRDVAAEERAILEIEDLSLRPDNPYAASSLVPPPRRPFRLDKTIAIAAVVLVAAAGAWLALRSVATRAPQPPARSAQRRAPAPRTEQPRASAQPAPVAQPRTSVAPDESAAPAAEEVLAEESAAKKASPSASPIRDERAADGTRARPAPERPEVEDSALALSAHSAVASPGAAPATSPEQSLRADTQPTAAEEATAAPDTSTSTAATDTAEAAPLPLTPTREQVVAGFAAIAPELTRCAAGKRGVVEISATLASSGRVSYALIGGIFQGTPEGSCMARAVRGARFPQFSQPTLKVSYPIAL